MAGLHPENWSMMEVPHLEFTDLSDCFSYDEEDLVELSNKSEDSSSSKSLVELFNKSKGSSSFIVEGELAHKVLVELSNELKDSSSSRDGELVEFDKDLRDRFSCNEEIVVGFKDEVESLLDQLTGISKQLQLISIVGMPGIGKSTLARKVYNDPLIVYHFHVRAWISISQVYNKRDLLIGILRSVTQLSDEYYHEVNDIKLVEVLHKCLKCNRYLIVLDDIWSREAWNDLEKSFPDDNLGSKIMITSRLLDLNLNVRGQPITPHLLHLRFLTEKESVVLLAKKVFRSGIFPVALEKIGKRIAKGCRGLPLAIVVISGLLESKGASIRWWKHVAESVSSYIASDQYPCMDTLALSYFHLPQHLRPLFLYFGLFPEDFEIPACRLIWSWVAEGLVIDTLGRKSLEETANDYLMELIKRSLVVVSKTGSDGGIKACRIHDLLRDLCLQKAKEEKFSPRIYRCLEKGAVPSETLELLRVLDLGSVSVLVFPCEILQLVHVRYFAIKAEDGSPPASLSNLLTEPRHIIKEEYYYTPTNMEASKSETLPYQIRRKYY